MLSDFLTPIQIKPGYTSHQIGSAIQAYTTAFPELEGIELAIVGVQDGRSSAENHGTSDGPDAIREQFYGLSANPQLIEKIVDLGNILPGSGFSDTEIALRTLITELRAKDIVTVVLGGSMHLGYAMYQAMEGVSNNLDVTCVSPYLPIMEAELLSRICEHKPNYLFNINALGFQSHHVPYRSLDIMNKLGFNQLRLGHMRAKPDEAEPLIRNTDLFLLDVGVVKQADSPATYKNNPNGLDGDQACKLCWYAGVSDLTRAIGIFEMNPEFDNRAQSAKLCAQMVWYFMDGYNNRVNDHPEKHKEFLRYRCNLDGKQPDIIFHKSKRTSRWWMEIANPKSMNNTEMNVFVQHETGVHRRSAPECNFRCNPIWSPPSIHCRN